MKTKTAFLGVALSLVFCSQAFGSNAHTLPIALDVICPDSPKLRNAVEGLFTGELRRLGNVAVVGVEDRYALAIHVLVFTLTTGPGTPTGYTIASSLTSSLPMEYAILQKAI